MEYEQWTSTYDYLNGKQLVKYALVIMIPFHLKKKIRASIQKCENATSEILKDI
jgi:hypothetical protein